MKKNKTIFPNLYLALILSLMFVPIILVVIYSFNSSKISSIWGEFSLHWYQELFENKGMLEALINSLILGLSSSVAAGIIGTLGAIGMTRVQAKTNTFIEFITTLPIMIPEIILAMVFLAFFSLLGFPFGMTTLILAHTAFCIPYVFMMVKARLVGMDKSLTEAARDLGASEWRVFFDITLPLIAPAIFSGMVLSFAMSFDDVIISIFVTGVNVNTLPIKIYTQMKTVVTPEINALCTLMLLVTLLLVAGSSFLSKINAPEGKENS